MPPSSAVQGCKDPFHNAGRQKQGESLSCSKCPCRRWFYYCQLHLHLLQLMPQHFHFHLAPPPFPTQACQERRGKVLGNSLWNLACEAQIYQSNDCACVHAFVPTLPSHQREEREGVSKGCPYSPPSLFLCAHTYACTHTHICLSLEINGLLLRPLIRSCAAGKTCMIPHCAQRLTTESAAPISAVSTENNEGATQGFWNGPVKGQDSLPQHGASWPKDKRVLSLIRVAADKSAFPMCSITATGSEPFQHLYPGCQLWSLLTPIRHQ